MTTSRPLPTQSIHPLNDGSFSAPGGAPIGQPDPSDKRERILDAAIQVFAERGFYHARVSEVAAAAGVAGGTIYNYFKSKDDLLISLFEDRMDAILADFRSRLDGLDSASDRLRRFIELHLEMVAGDPALAEVLTVELRQSSKFMREYKALKFGEYLLVIEDIIERGRARGEFRDDVDARILKRVIFGALDEVSLFWVDARRNDNLQPYALDRAAEQIWRVCVGGLLPSPDRHERSTP
ncbi:MAG: TetR/AcrR family transcriptional regulator [Myxococcales bacterium]|nr:TetR/AcrR family transcriptional regulator [Myxococcales bacterium]